MQRRNFTAAAAVPLLGPLLAPVVAGAATTAQRIGTAIDAGGGAVLYRESHIESFEGDRLVADRVSYTDASGQRFAAKQVRFPATGFVPDFRYENTRTGHLEACERLGGNRIKVSFREGGSGALETRELQAPDNALQTPASTASSRPNGPP